MFCPRCGQQAAEEVRFCSRRGLPLDAAAEIVASEGRPEWLAARDDAPARAVPVSFYANTSADTSDMTASPLSVTEGTTRLLDESEEGGRR